MVDCHTFYSDRKHMSDTNTSYVIAGNAIIGCSNIFLNGFLIYAILKLQKPLNLSYKLIVCLSISEFCVGLLAQSLFGTVLLVDHEKASCTWDIATQCIVYLTLQFSGLMVIIISLDRYIHMKYLNKYNEYMTTKVAKILVGSAMTTVTCLMVASIFVSFYGGYSRGYFAFHTGVLGIEAVLVTGISVLYISTYLSVRNRAQQSRIQVNGLHNKDGDTKINKPNTRRPHNLNLAKTMVFILLTTAVCYLPFVIVGFIHSYTTYIQIKDPGESLHTLLFWSYLFVCLNSSCNVVIFASRNTNIRRLIYSIICGDRSERNVRTGTPSSTVMSTMRKD